MAITPHRTFRASDDIWRPAQARAAREGTDITAVLVAFLIEYGQAAQQPTTKRARRRSPERADAKEK